MNIKIKLLPIHNTILNSYPSIISGTYTTGNSTTESSTESQFTQQSDSPESPTSRHTFGITRVAIVIASSCLLIIAGFLIFSLLYKRRKDSIASKSPVRIAASDKKLIKTKSIPLAAVLNGQIPIPPQDEFTRLTKYGNGISQQFTVSEGQRYNKTGCYNLSPENLPFDHNRVTLKTPVKGCDYVNASWLSKSSDGQTYDELIYTSYLPFEAIVFVIGQDPTPDTMPHHLRMLLENQIDMVVSFGDNDSLMSLQVGKTYNFESLSLNISSMEKITDILFKTKITIADATAAGDQNIHKAVHYHCIAWSKDGTECIEDIEGLVLSICFIRNAMKTQSSFLKVFTHDSRGGVQGASFFVVLYDLMQRVDEGLTEDNQVKSSVANVDIFSTVHRIRKDRANAIENFTSYKNLFLCLNYYGPNRGLIQQKVSKYLESKCKTDFKETKMDQNYVIINDDQLYGSYDTSSDDEDEIDYVMHGPSLDEYNRTFSYYSDEEDSNAVEYPNNKTADETMYFSQRDLEIGQKSY